ncbi:MAG: 16S rRNA (adenine(1518)-N(6)/adenine(1519)-N(6))-dimethyltransferase RsmA [Alphaproteobacteria bacterium]|nr:16S rRNA (adenine(1518)-N(6)/adenine(1519)-N(6))-dimethyltransferase RsmA [Alphaproteobacteria bacterium]
MNRNTPFGAAKKSLGQHFLFDRDLLRRIALAGGPVEGRTVIEVGPGPGGLTRALLDAGVAKLIAVEMDDRFAADLASWPEFAAGRLEVQHADARTIDAPALIATAGGSLPALIVANLPYNVGTPLVVNWLKAGPAGQSWRDTMVLMFQKEVAERICAAPGEDHYGRLAVLAHGACRAHIAMTLPPGEFRPPPKVDSAVVVLEPLGPEDAFADLEALETVSASAFGQRRKMLRAALKTLGGPLTPDMLLQRAGIDGTRRAETLTQAEFRRLAEVWRAAQSQDTEK